MLKRLKILILVLSIFIALVTVITLLLQKTLFAPKHTITEIAFAPESIAIYDNPYLYKDIAEQYSGANYFMLRWFNQDDKLQTVQQLHPLVADIVLQRNRDRALYVTITFESPPIVFVV